MVLFDFSQIFYRYAMPEVTRQSSLLKNNDIKKVDYTEAYKNVRYGVIKSILLFKKNNDINIKNYILCCDHGTWREKENPFYKKRRKENKDENIDWDSFNDQMSIIANEISDLFEIPMLSIKDAEGDDIIGTLTNEFNNTHNIFIISSDKDFKQLLKYKTVKIFDPVKNEFMKVKKPKLYLISHILMGDATDDVPNIFNPIDFYTNTPINEKTGKPQRAKGLGESKINQWFGDDVDKETRRKNLKEIKSQYKERYEQNRQMISLDFIPDYIIEKILNVYENKNIILEDRKISRNKLFDYLKKYEIPDLKKDIQTGLFKLR